MPIEELRQIDAETIPVGKLLYMIDKAYTMYVNHNIAEYGINTTQLHLLFEISHQSNINQEKIAARNNINKGAVARSIKKLEDNGLVKREIDENNRRQNKLSLTKNGEDILEKAIKVLHNWEDSVIPDNSLMKRELKEIAIKSMELNQEKQE